MNNQNNDINQLPKDWKWVKLGEACEIVSGNTPKGLELISNKGEYQFYKVSDMNLVGNEIRMNVSNLKLTLEEIKKLKVKVYPKGTVIFPKRGGAILTNKKRVLSKDASFDLNVMGILPNDKLSSNYLFYWIQKLDLSKIYDGSNVPQINNKNVAPLDFPLPPKPTQHAIVSKIEELFSELDKGIENLRLAQQQLKTYRQSVLKWAFEGKLTNENVEEGELPEGWRIFKIGEVCKTIDGDRGPNYPKKEEFFSEGYCLYLSTKNVREDRFRFDDTMFITKEKDEKLRSGKLQLNDVVITTRGTLGNVALYDERIPFQHVRINSGMLILRITNEHLNNYYLMKFITSPIFISQLKDKQTGTAQPQIPANILREIEISLPSIEEQNQIVQEIESRLSVADKMEESITQSLQQAEALRQSILKKAFEGRLV
jgi:type I restriction enzyme S subunit